MTKFFQQLLPYLIIIATVVLIRIFIVTPVRVNGTSMNDTLSSGEIMLLLKYKRYFANDYKRYDIVVIKYENSRLIKRVIGLPNERIKCVDGIIYINDEKISDEYATNETSDFDEITLKDNEYYVMGDNRLVSKDSRMIGPIVKDKILGTSNLVIFPFNEIKKVK